MMITIEDLLQAHGFGGNSGGGTGGVRIIPSTTEPTINVSDGVFWFNPTTLETRIYVENGFKPLSAGFVITPFHSRVVLPSTQSAVFVNAISFDPHGDILFVSQNGTHIQESIDFTLDKVTKRIVKTFGSWEAGTIFDFTVLALTKTSVKDNLMMMELRHNAVASQTERTVPFSISQFNPDLDKLEVYIEGVRVFEGHDWTLDITQTSITFEYDLIEGERIVFLVRKKIRDYIPSDQFDGSLLADETVTRPKLGSFYTQIEDDVQELKNSSDKSIDLSTGANINNNGEMVMYLDPATGNTEMSIQRLLVDAVDIVADLTLIREDSLKNTDSLREETNEKINSVLSALGVLEELTQGELDELRKSIRIDSSNNIIMGKIDGTAYVKFETDRWIVYKNGVEALVVGNAGVESKTFKASETLQVGNFAFVARANGSIDFKKVVG